AEDLLLTLRRVHVPSSRSSPFVWGRMWYWLCLVLFLPEVKSLGRAECLVRCDPGAARPIFVPTRARRRAFGGRESGTPGHRWARSGVQGGGARARAPPHAEWNEARSSAPKWNEMPA